MKKIINDNAIALVSALTVMLLIPADYVTKLIIMCVAIVAICMYKIVGLLLFIRGNKRVLAMVKEEKARQDWRKRFFNNYPTISR